METHFLNAVGEVETKPRPYLESLSTDALRGLSERVAQRRRALNLGNDIRFKTSRTYLQVLFHNTITFFNVVLFALGVSLVVLGKPVEALITSCVVLANVFISVIQELRAKCKLDQIALLIFLYFMVTTGDMLYAQQALSYTMVVIGLLLFVFVEPPSRIWVRGEALSVDRRPLLLAIGLFLLFIACFAIPQVRELYDLEPLRCPLDYVIVGLVVASWAAASRIAWCARLLDKYLNVDLGGPRK